VALAKTEPYSPISAGDLKFECVNTGGTFGEVTDSKSGAHYYWCKHGAQTIKCVDKKCTVTTPILGKTPVVGAPGNSRNPGAAAPGASASGSAKIGATTSGGNRTLVPPKTTTSPTATTIGIPKPVIVPGPVSNNNKRQQQ
jgi:hypothetical protein